MLQLSPMKKCWQIFFLYFRHEVKLSNFWKVLSKREKRFWSIKVFDRLKAAEYSSGMDPILQCLSRLYVYKWNEFSFGYYSALVTNSFTFETLPFRSNFCTLRYKWRYSNSLGAFAQLFSTTAAYLEFQSHIFFGNNLNLQFFFSINFLKDLSFLV